MAAYSPNLLCQDEWPMGMDGVCRKAHSDDESHRSTRAVTAGELDRVTQLVFDINEVSVSVYIH